MASKKLKVQVGLDFTSDNMSIEKIREQIDAAVSAVKINLDPESAKKFETELRELGGILERHLNQNTGKINAKNLVADLDNNENFLMIEKLGQRYAEVGVNGQQSFRKIANEADFLSKKISSSNTVLEKMGTTLMNTIRWNISSSVVNAVTGEFQKMYYFAKDLDRTLTDIRIVSGQSADQMERFAIHANESAQALKVSTIEYAQAATIFFQQGLEEADVKKMTDGAVMASRITGTAVSEMVDLLTSTMNGYRLAADEVLTVTDKLAAVGATTASNFEELSTGMSKVASMANTAGVTIDELNAQLATIISVTRESPESIGTSLKTIYGRMLMFKTDTKALMEDEDGEVFGAPKVEEALQAYSRVAGAQISLFKTTADGRRELRDLGEVIEEIGDSWDDVTDKTAKFGVATALAGSRQQNRLIALFDSWDMYKEAVETSLNAEGTTLKQNAIYMESYEGRLKGLQAAKEEMYMVLTDSDSMKSFIGALTEGVQLFTKLIDMAGGFSAILGIIGVAFSDNLVKKAYEFQQAFALPKEMKEIGNNNEQIKSLKELHAISKVFGADEANRYREDLRNKKAALKEMKRESQLLVEKQTLLTDISEVAEMGDNEAKKKAVIDSLIAEAEARGVAVQSAEELRVKYNELAEAERNLKELEQLSYGEAIGDQIHRDVEAAQAVVDEIESQIDSIHEKAIEAAKHGNKAYKDVEGQLGKTNAEIAAKAKEAERLALATQATRAAFMLLPAAISGATDSSKSLNEVLKNIAMLSIPSIVTALQPVIASLGVAKGAAGAFNMAMLGPLKVIAGVAAAAMALAAIIKLADRFNTTLEKQKEIVETLSSEVNSLQSEYDQLFAIEDRTDAQENRLALLKEELEIEKEKLRIQQEQLINQQFFTNTKDPGTGWTINSEVGADRVRKDIQDLIDKQEELANTDVKSEEWSDLNDEIVEIKSSLIDQLKTLDDAIERYDNLDDVPPKFKELAEEIREVVIEEETLKDIINDSINSFEELDTNLSSTITQMNNFSDGMSSLDNAYAQLLSKNQLTVSDLVSLQEQFGDVTGFDDFINTVGTATSVTEEVQDAFDSLLSSYLETSDMLKLLDEGNKDLIISQLELMGVTNAEEIATELLANRTRQLAAEQEALAIEKDFLTKKGYELTDATWEEINAFINQQDASEDTKESLARLALEKINLNETQLNFSSDIDQVIALANAAGASTAALARLKRAKEIFDQAPTFKASSGFGDFQRLQEAERVKEELNSGIFDFQFTPLNADVYKKATYIGGSKTRDTIDKAKKSGSSSKPKEEKAQYDYDKDLQALESFLVKYIKKRGELEKKAIDDWYKKEIEALDKIHKAKIDAYKEDLQRYKDVADEKIRLLNDTYDEENYFEDLTKEKEEERRIQSQIDKLALDDSSRANDERRRLRELLAQQVEKIADMERSREKDLKVQAYRDAVTIKENEINNLIDQENELYEDSKAKIEATKDIRLEVWEKSYDDAAVYAEASKAITSGLVKDFNGKMVSVKNAYVDFENRYGSGMGILGDKTKKEFLATIDRVNLGMRGLKAEAGYVGTTITNNLNKGNTAARNLSSSIGRVGTSARNATKEVKKLNAELSKKPSTSSGGFGGFGDFQLAQSRGYATGGKIDYTGLANVHGTPSEPEYVFNYPQFRDLAKYIAHERNRMPTVPTASTGGMGQGIKIGNLIEIKGDVTHDVLPLLEKEVDKGIVKLRNMIEKQVGSPSRI